MEQEMVSTPVDDAPAFLQLRDKYKQDLVEDTRLTKATYVIGQWCARRLETPSTQIGRTSTTPLDQKSTPTIWCPCQWGGWNGCPRDSDRREWFWCWTRASVVDAIGQDCPGYRTERLYWGTIHSRQKTTCTTQTQYHSECQKETAVHTRGEHGWVSQRATFFRRAQWQTLGGLCPHFCRQT